MVIKYSSPGTGKNKPSSNLTPWVINILAGLLKVGYGDLPLVDGSKPSN